MKWYLRVALVLVGVALTYIEGRHQADPGVLFGVGLIAILTAVTLGPDDRRPRRWVHRCACDRPGCGGGCPDARDVL